MDPSHVRVFLVFVILGVAASSPMASVDTSGCQRNRQPKKVHVSGWPVMAAVQLTSMADDPIKLQFQHNNVTHTNLSFAKPGRMMGDMMMVEVRVESEGAKNTSFPVLVSSHHWTSVRVNLHQRNLIVVAMTQSGASLTTDSTIFTTKNQLHLLHHLGVDTLSHTCTHVCLADVDLECLQGQKSQHEPHTQQEHMRADMSSRGTPVWPFLVVLVMLLVVVLLYLTWRYQHQQVKTRRQRQTNAASGRSNHRGRTNGSPRETSTSSVSQDANSDQSVQYSTILLGYNGPCTDDQDAT